MRIDRDNIEEILITISRNKTRSLLTAFGVFWGIFMLVFMLGGGHGMKEMLVQQLAGFASNAGFIAADQTGTAYKGFRKGRTWDLELADVENLKRVKELETVIATSSLWGKTFIHDDKKYEDGTLQGVTPDFAKIQSTKLKYGRYINDMDVLQGRKVCVIGKFIYERCFAEGEDPCGKYMQIDGVYYLIVGVSNDDGSISVQGWPPECVTIPFSTMQRLYNFGNTVQLIGFTVKKGVNVKEVQPKIERIVKENHLISPDDKQAVMFINTEALFKMVDNLMTGFDILIWMVGLGTLLAGAIGVSNIMMVTVKERTTEIGIRRAIGARPLDIMQQIMSESIMLTGVAGMGGICFAVFLLNILETATGESDFQVSFWLAIGTCLILLLLSILAGLAPAYRAMAIKPIDAIRDE
ncbi:MAG: ABC transporter permease [Bacteroidaceae bacterium]|nr:ABC transporter permease [Bacteroidaceae bacterium]